MANNQNGDSKGGSMKSLYALTTEMNNLMDSDEVTDLQLQEVFGNITDKAQNCAQYSQTLKSQITVFDDEIKRLQERKKALVNHHDRFLEYIKLNMERLELDKLSAGTFTITLATNSEALELTDESKIPAKYIITTTTTAPDKSTIKAALKNGEVIPGAILTRGKSVRIR